MSAVYNIPNSVFMKFYHFTFLQYTLFKKKLKYISDLILLGFNFRKMETKYSTIHFSDLAFIWGWHKANETQNKIPEQNALTWTGLRSALDETTG